MITSCQDLSSGKGTSLRLTPAVLFAKTAALGASAELSRPSGEGAPPSLPPAVGYPTPHGGAQIVSENPLGLGPLGARPKEDGNGRPRAGWCVVAPSNLRAVIGLRNTCTSTTRCDQGFGGVSPMGQRADIPTPQGGGLTPDFGNPAGRTPGRRPSTRPQTLAGGVRRLGAMTTHQGAVALIGTEAPQKREQRAVVPARRDGAFRPHDAVHVRQKSLAHRLRPSRQTLGRGLSPRAGNYGDSTENNDAGPVHQGHQRPGRPAVIRDTRPPPPNGMDERELPSIVRLCEGSWSMQPGLPPCSR